MAPETATTQPAAAPDWAHGFEPYSAVHGAVVLATVAMAWVVIARGRKWRGTNRQRYWDRGLSVAALLVWLIANGYWLLPRNFWPDISLPIHVSDVVGLAVPVALVMAWPWARAVLYFWGLGLTTQAYFSPVVMHGPAAIEFWLFWLGHGAIITGVFYDLIVRGYRPSWRDYGRSLVALICYATVIVPINLLLDANYGFAGRLVTEQATLLDYLGPWPFRLLPLAGLAVIAVTLPMLPWLLLPALARRRRSAVYEAAHGNR